jgi:acyl-CoA synthetase (AMP-forming)/AMP-acid ligase II
MFTSGTTGNPKGVMLTHENIISNLQYIETYFDLRGLKTICVARPLVHIAVLTGEVLYALCCGLTIYFYEETFMPQRLLTFFQHKNIDVFCATPTLYQTLAIIANDKAFPIKVGVLSGEVLTRRTSENITKAFHNTRFYNVYGLTEHSPRVSALLPNDFVGKPGSVGKTIGNVELKIVDGELWVRSASVMKGYYLDTVNTQEKLQDGWLRTGDSAHFDKDGYLYIDGRKDGMLIKAGINVYPEEIENVVKEILGIDDCLVFGEFTDMGTVICMKYIGDLDIKELRKQLIGKLNPNIVPSKIEKVEELARTMSGKKLRR